MDFSLLKKVRVKVFKKSRCLSFFHLFQTKDSIFCNGHSWNASLRSCSRTDALPKLLCKFEDEDICGWTQPMDNSSWIVLNDALVYESTNLTRSSKSAIFSPTYAGDYLKNSCLSIMFKQSGYNMGTFNVFIVPENDEDLNSPLLTFKGNKGPQWNLWTVALKDQTNVQGPFQIVQQKKNDRAKRALC